MHVHSITLCYTVGYNCDTKKGAKSITDKAQELSPHITWWDNLNHSEVSTFAAI